MSNSVTVVTAQGQSIWNMRAWCEKNGVDYFTIGYDLLDKIDECGVAHLGETEFRAPGPL